jgi:hypothetical protein
VPLSGTLLHPASATMPSKPAIHRLFFIEVPNGIHCFPETRQLTQVLRVSWCGYAPASFPHKRAIFEFSVDEPYTKGNIMSRLLLDEME